MNESTPVLSLRTRELRWQRVRDLMRAHDLGCLLVGGLRGREHFETYLALAPDGQYANDAKQYLQIIDATVPAAVRTRKK